MPTDPGTTTLLLLAAFTLLVLNALLVICSTALNKISRTFVKIYDNENNNKKAHRLLMLIEKPSKYVYTNKILNYVLIFSALLITLEAIPKHEDIVIGIFALITVILSELLPRKVALSHVEALSLYFVNMQYVLCIAFTPVTKLIMGIVNIFLKVFKQNTDVDDEVFSEDNVMSMLDAGQDSGIIKEEGKNMINSIFAFDDELAYEIMTPRTDVFLIDINDPQSEYLDELMELKHSRIPVCKDETDNIIGILNVKDFLIQARKSGFENVDIGSILREPYMVPDTKNIDSLFFELQKSRQHIAILINEYGGFSGIVTMEDIIEEVMGDIDDEYDEEVKHIVKLDDYKYIVNGNVYLSDIKEEIGISLDSSSSETIGGFVIDMLGEIPKDGYNTATINYEDCEIKVINVKEQRIEQVEITITKDEKQEDN